MPDHSNGKIYKIINTETDDVYIGSTTQALHDRMKNHRFRCAHGCHVKSVLYTKMEELGRDKFSIHLLENYPCQSNRELLEREGFWQRQQATHLQTVLAGQTADEILNNRKQYRDKYRANHREELNNKKLCYYYDNRERVLAKHSQRYVCVCGTEYDYGHKSRHMKTKHHIKYLEQKKDMDNYIDKSDAPVD